MITSVRTQDNHTFILCAYKDSPYTGACLQSLLNQTEKSSVIISTSTPSEYLKQIADKYHVELYTHSDNAAGIASDWNYALSLVKARYITLAHQDDIYEPEYTERVLAVAGLNTRPQIIFTDYRERRGEEIVSDNRLLRTKRFLLYPMRTPSRWNSRFWKRRILSLGNPICCPSVTYCMDNIQLPLFRDNMGSNIDWQAWEELSRLDGAFAYIPEKLVQHRIHEGSETSKLIRSGDRAEEDLYMLGKFWPKSIANLIEVFYSRGERSNTFSQ